MRYFFIFSILFFTCFPYREKNALKKDPYYLYLLYSHLINEREYKKAREIIVNLHKEYPDNREYLKEYIKFLYGFKEYKKVKENAEVYIEKFSNTDKEILIYYLTACVYMEDKEAYLRKRPIFLDAIQGDRESILFLATMDRSFKEYEKALSLLNEYIKKDKENEYVYMEEKAKVLVDMEKYEDAISIFKKLEENKPSYILFIEMGNAYENIKKDKEAIESYEKALSLNPSDILVMEKIAELSIQLNLYDKAEEFLNRVISAAPFSADARRKRGFVFYEKENYTSAIEDFLFSLEIEPNDITHYYLSRVYFRLNKWEKAFKHIEDALKINPRSVEYYAYYGFLLITKGNLEKAKRILMRGLRIQKKDPTVNYLLGYLFNKKNKKQLALKYYKEAIKSDSLDAQKWFELGALLESMDRIKEAEDCFKKVIKLDSTNASAYNYWGYMLAERGLQLDFAISLIKKALAYEPDNGYYIDSLGWAYFKKGLFIEAKKYLEQAVSLVNSDPVILEHMGDIYNTLGLKEKAKDCWRKALEIQPYNHSLKKKVQDE